MMRESSRNRRLGKNRIVLALDSQALHAFQACDQKYWIANAEKLVPIRSKRAYEIGSMVHEIMHHITRARLNRREFNDIQLLQVGYNIIRRARIRGLLNDEDLSFHTSKFTQFYAWEKKLERFYKPIACEAGFSKILYEDHDVIFVYEGRIDYVLRVEPTGFNSWADYKTQSREYAIYANRNQFVGYSWAVGTNIGFMIYYGLQKEKENPFKMQTIYHHPGLIEQWRQDTIRSFRRILTLLPFGSSAFERNRSACDSGKFGNCPYTILCDNAWAGPEIQKALRSGFFKESDWSPWK